MFNNDINRRQFILRQAKTLLGVSTISPLLSNQLLANTAAKAKAQNVIHLFMDGGMSHIDTFDLKLDNKTVQGPVTGIKTSETGLKITDKLPRLAKHMNKFAQIRSMHHTQGNHEPALYYMYTGFEHEPGVIVHPSLGAWVSKLGTKSNPNLPIYVRSGSLAGHPANGFFEVQDAPLPISSPTAGLQNSKHPEWMTKSKFQKNLSFAQKMDKEFLSNYNSKQVRAYSDLYKDAIAMMSSKDLEAFDINKEPEKIKKLYGDETFSQGCLLARKLVEKGVRFVEVDLGGWDSHTDNHKQVTARCKILDEGLNALMTDLENRGLLETTLVVISTEFGRSPNIDEYAGRGHNPLGFTTLMAGAGINGGAIYGKTDNTGREAVDKHTSSLDFNATIAWALGLDMNKLFLPFAGGQKFSVIGKDTGTKGRPITEIFS
ncbi:MAG: DUF1501 domain-containing protein [Lentisphaeraceae bacterium]|nr:DUF1501 domain-containing protein [Lentisphaeraceae bacterium]